MKCWFGRHDWKHTERHRYRRCQRCQRRERAWYDSTGNRFWEKTT